MLALRRDDVTWIGGRVPAPARGGVAPPLDLCMWVAPGESSILACSFVPSGEAPGEVARLFRQALLAPTAEVPVGRPSRIAVHPEPERDGLDEIMRLFDLSWDPEADFGSLDEVVRDLREQGEAAVAEERGDLDPQVGFNRAVGALLEAAPWKFGGPDQVMQVDGLFPEPVFVLMEAGEAKETVVSFLLGWEALQGCARARELAEASRLPILQLSFVPHSMCAPALRRAMEDPGWGLPPEVGYPVLLRLDRQPPHHVATKEELRPVLFILDWLSVLPFERGRFECSLALGAERTLVAQWPVSPQAGRTGGRRRARKTDPARPD